MNVSIYIYSIRLKSFNYLKIIQNFIKFSVLVPLNANDTNKNKAHITVSPEIVRMTNYYFY